MNISYDIPSKSKQFFLVVMVIFHNLCAKCAKCAIVYLASIDTDIRVHNLTSHVNDIWCGYVYERPPKNVS